MNLLFARLDESSSFIIQKRWGTMDPPRPIGAPKVPRARPPLHGGALGRQARSAARESKKTRTQNNRPLEMAFHLSIKMLVPFHETQKVDFVPARPVEMGLSEGCRLKKKISSEGPA